MDILKSLIKNITVVITVLVLTISFAHADKKKKDKKKKDCVYCLKYEKMVDWPESERPTAFIWEDIEYPEGMFKEKLHKTIKRINQFKI